MATYRITTDDGSRIVTGKGIKGLIESLPERLTKIEAITLEEGTEAVYEIGFKLSALLYDISTISNTASSLIDSRQDKEAVAQTYGLLSVMEEKIRAAMGLMEALIVGEES